MAQYSPDPVSTNCYPGTTVLINRFDIRDEEKLLQAKRRKSCADHLIGNVQDLHNKLPIVIVKNVLI